MKLLILSRYSRMGASSRLRFYQYVPYLEAEGMKITIAPLLDDEYLMALYGGRKISKAKLSGNYLKRLCNLLDSRCYDLLWIEKELFPFLPPWGERLLNVAGKPYVVDYDDAIFHSYDMHGRWIVRRLLGKKIDTVMKHAALVIAGNDYLGERAEKAGVKRIERLPTVVDMERYPAISRSGDEVFTMGWIGSPSGRGYLLELKAVIEDVCRTGNARLMMIGAEEGGFDGVPVEFRPWTEETEAASIGECDAGIMPLADGAWERGKCGYKLIQYMACGLPVVASPVGVNREIVDHGVNGYLAGNDEEWARALTALRDDPQLRRKMGLAARRKVEMKYSLQISAPRLAEMLRSAAGRATRCAA